MLKGTVLSFYENGPFNMAIQLVNDTTKQQNSNFFNMAFIKEKDFGIALTTAGENPTKTKLLKQKIRVLLKNISLD